MQDIEASTALTAMADADELAKAREAILKVAAETPTGPMTLSATRPSTPALRRGEWDRRRKARKAASKSRARNRR